MKAIDCAEAQTWCTARGFSLGESGLPVFRSADGLEKFAIPRDAGNRVALVRAEMKRFEEEEEICIWLDDWGVWQSGQWWHIFERFRLSFGINESLVQRPCHVVQKAELDTAVSIVVFTVLMLADCHVLGSSGRAYTFFSHDEWGKRWSGKQPAGT